MKKLIIFDLDGVMYIGDEAVAHAPETVSLLRKNNFIVRFLTNNSTRTRKTFSDKLNGMGIEAAPEEIMSSAVATREYLKKRSPEGAKIYIVGEEGLYEELSCFEIVSREERTTADYVVVGYDEEFNYEKMALALDALLAGAEMIATNRDATFPAPGRILPGGGTIVAAIATAWQKEPVCCGKPDPFGIHFLMEETGCGAEETLLVGDRADSDIITGNRAGVDSCLVLTGITTAQEAPHLEGELKPTFIIKNLEELSGLLESISG